MKYFIIVFFGVAAFIFSCNKKDDSASNKTTASFNISGFEKAAPSTINFINVSRNATSFQWDFGDGTTSAQTDPTHIYNFSGSYSIKLKATGPSGSDSVCSLVSIAAPPPANKSEFSYFQTKCSGTPVGMSFKSINPLSTNAVWDFGSGLPLLDRDPITQIFSPGDYTIKYSTLINGVRDTLIRIIRID